MRLPRFRVIGQVDGKRAVPTTHSLGMFPHLDTIEVDPRLLVDRPEFQEQPFVRRCLRQGAQLHTIPGHPVVVDALTFPGLADLEVTPILFVESDGELSLLASLVLRVEVELPDPWHFRNISTSGRDLAP